MNLVEQLKECANEQEAHDLITKAIEQANKNSTKVDNLGFSIGSTMLENRAFKGFIPLDTRIKYFSLGLETYSMQTTDFLYEYADMIKNLNVDPHNNWGLVVYLQSFINEYFGGVRLADRNAIFMQKAEQTETDEEFFEALKSNKLGDLKGKGAAECTERSALAQQVLSLFGLESYYCVGCVAFGDKQAAHCFNIVKRKNDYALLDYSMPVPAYNKNGELTRYYPFVGLMTNEEFEDFCKNGTVKSFQNHEYRKGVMTPLDGERKYVVGKFQILQAVPEMQQ